jgi:hypothetical protein
MRHLWPYLALGVTAAAMLGIALLPYLTCRRGRRRP